MQNELIFYTNPISRGRTVRWMLEEVEQPYRTELLEYNTSMKSPAFLAINPLGKVPVLCHGNTVVSESAAICAYLADAFPAAGLAPALTDPQRGTYYRWLFLTSGPLETALINQAIGFVVPPDKARMVGYGAIDTMLSALEVVLQQGNYILGDQFSAADVYISSLLAWGMYFGGFIEKRPTFEQYCKLAQARPAAQRAAQMDDALISANHG